MQKQLHVSAFWGITDLALRNNLAIYRKITIMKLFKNRRLSKMEWGILTRYLFAWTL